MFLIIGGASSFWIFIRQTGQILSALLPSSIESFAAKSFISILHLDERLSWSVNV